MTFAIESLTTVTGLVISFFSLWISFRSYAQSVPRLLLNMWIGSEYDLKSKKKSDDSILMIQIVNTSSRPVTLTGLGGHYNSRLSRWLRTRLPWVPQPTSFVFQDIRPIIFDGSGKPRVLADGEIISHQLPVKKDTGTGFKAIRSFCVYDAAGREYFLSRIALRNLKKHLTELNKEEKLSAKI